MINKGKANILSIALIFIFSPYKANASCIEKWSGEKEQQCSDHRGGVWWYESESSYKMLKKAGEQHDSSFFILVKKETCQDFIRKGRIFTQCK